MVNIKMVKKNNGERASSTADPAVEQDAPKLSYSTPKSSKSPPKEPKSSTRAPRESVDWSKLDKPSFEFKIHYGAPQPRGKKRKRQSEVGDGLDIPTHTQPDPWQTSQLTATYWVEPSHLWENMTRYSKMKYHDETYRVGDNVRIRAFDAENLDPSALPSGSSDDGTENFDLMGRILEIRALDGNHVYFRFYYYYVNAELPRDVRPNYHGRRELVASNYMQILNSDVINGRAEIKFWNEAEPSTEVLDPDKYYWRQTYNITTKELSTNINLHCKDDYPFDPDTLLVQCKTCEKWNHGPCLVLDALQRAHLKHHLPYKPPTNFQPTTRCIAGRPEFATPPLADTAAGANGNVGMDEGITGAVKDIGGKVLNSLAGGSATPSKSAKPKGKTGKGKRKSSGPEPTFSVYIKNKAGTVPKLVIQPLSDVGIEGWEEDVMCLCCGAQIV